MKSDIPPEKVKEPNVKAEIKTKEISDSSKKVKSDLQELKQDSSDPSKIETNFQKLSGLKKTGEELDVESGSAKAA